MYYGIYSSNFSLSPYLKTTLANNSNAAFTFVDNIDNGDNIYLEMDRITTTRIPNGSVEIYIAENESYLVQLEPQNKSFAGIISLFDLQSTAMHKNVQRINFLSACFFHWHRLQKSFFAMAAHQIPLPYQYSIAAWYALYQK